MSFTEPNLSFELLNNTNEKEKRVRIKFDLESKPKSSTNGQEYFVDILANNKEIGKIIEGLKDELVNYPERKPTA